MKAKTWIVYGIITLSILSSYIIFFFCTDAQLIDLTLEDHFFEWMGFWFLLTASILFFVTYILDKNSNDLFVFKTRKNIFYLLLGLVFLFGAGEEISWGQRIFHFHTGALMNRLNDQEEMNIHNLRIFKGILNFDHLFTMFWISFCVLIPIVNWKYEGANKFLKRINMPVVPLWLTFFYVLSYTIFLALKVSMPHLLHQISEVKETSISEMFFILSITGLLENQHFAPQRIQSVTQRKIR
jgi:hypothetical protein